MHETRARAKEKAQHMPGQKCTYSYSSIVYRTLESHTAMRGTVRSLSRGADRSKVKYSYSSGTVWYGESAELGAVRESHSLDMMWKGGEEQLGFVK